MNIFTQKEYSNSLWNIMGNFDEFKEKTVITDDTFYAENKKISLTTKFERNKEGVVIRRDVLKNIGTENVTINVLSSKFSLDGGEYEVYSQYNGWQNESCGQWQPLTSSISVISDSVRNASSAAPFIVIWSKQHNRGVAFHINAHSAWEMKISKLCIDGSESAFVEIEMGVLNTGLKLNLLPDEAIELPEIIYYDVLSKTDMDCWRLHNYLNEKYPRKTVPVIYNTWLYKFDRFTSEDIIEQIKKAAELGVEYFVIDAGWFGEGSEWWKNRGDWNENLTYGFKGQMCKISKEVREAGMRFGFWIEAECAAQTSEIRKQHPEYFIDTDRSCFIDFANEAAKQYIFDKTCELIDRYGAEFVKFDFNADLKYDKYHSGFIKYEKGHSDYIRMLRKKYPDLYIENCASGGMRMAVRDGKLYDSFWPTDNQSPYYSLDIFKNTLLRMPPQWIESWISICSAEKFSYIYDTPGKADKIFSTNDATWSNIVSVNTSFLNGLLTGRPVGLSFDLTALTKNDFNNLKEFISKFKQKREFWQNAACHIITDTETMLVLEFRSLDFSQVELLVFSKKAVQNNIRVYPVLNSNFKCYTVGEQTRTIRDITDNGIDFAVNSNFSCQFATLTAKDKTTE